MENSSSTTATTIALYATWRFSSVFGDWNSFLRFLFTYTLFLSFLFCFLLFFCFVAPLVLCVYFFPSHQACVREWSSNIMLSFSVSLLLWAFYATVFSSIAIVLQHFQMERDNANKMDDVKQWSVILNKFKRYR